MTLAEKISKNQKKIEKYLDCGYVKWDKLIERIYNQELNKNKNFSDEQIWTFIIACGYAITGQQGINKLCSLLTGIDNLESNKIWFEVLPTSPRIKEGPTHLDLAIGNIKDRKNTKSGIELDPIDNSWIVFCEMKWYSDLSDNVTYDQHRNQLSRVIENAITFQKNGLFADKVFVSLVTPAIFMNKENKSRLYSYKFEEYNDSVDRLKNDFSNCKLEKKYDKKIWNYPNNIEDRLSKLTLKWSSFDSLFDSMPDSDILIDIKCFENEFNYAKK